MGLLARKMSTQIQLRMQFQGTYRLPKVCALDPNLRPTGLEDFRKSLNCDTLHGSIFPNITMESEDQMSNFGFSSSRFIILGTYSVEVKTKKQNSTFKFNSWS